MPIQYVSLLAFTALSLAACKGSPADTSGGGGGDEGTSDDTGDTSTDTGIVEEWRTADINPGTYQMTILNAVQNTCTPAYSSGAIFDVEVVPNAGKIQIWGYISLESKGSELRAQGRSEQTNDATGDGAPDCTLTLNANGMGDILTPAEFRLTATIEKSGIGDYCGSEYIGFPLPCTDAFTGTFSFSGGPGGPEEGG